MIRACCGPVCASASIKGRCVVCSLVAGMLKPRISGPVSSLPSMVYSQMLDHLVVLHLNNTNSCSSDCLIIFMNMVLNTKQLCQV